MDPFFNVGPVMADPRAFIKIETRPTLYEAWAAGHRWVLFQGNLCRIAATVPGDGKLLLIHRQGSVRLGGMAAMTELVTPCRPNSRQFDLNRRGK